MSEEVVDRRGDPLPFAWLTYEVGETSVSKMLEYLDVMNNKLRFTHLLQTSKDDVRRHNCMRQFILVNAPCPNQKPCTCILQSLNLQEQYYIPVFQYALKSSMLCPIPTLA